MTLPLPPILYGTAWKKDATQRLVAEAIRQGFRGIDTACQPKHYDEAGVGRGVAQCLAGDIAHSDTARGNTDRGDTDRGDADRCDTDRGDTDRGEAARGGIERGDLYLQTKFTPRDGQDPKRIPYDPRAALDVQIAQSFEASLENLQTSYVDCLVLHSPLRTFSQTLAAWRVFEAIADSRRARRLGISNCYSLEALESLYGSAAVKPAVVQNRFYKETGYDAGIRAFCRAHGIVYQSFWTLTANPQLLASSAIRTIAAHHGRTPEQVLFRYLTQQDVVPLTGTTSIEHMREDLAIFEFTLTDDEQAAVTALLG